MGGEGKKKWNSFDLKISRRSKTKISFAYYRYETEARSQEQQTGEGIA